MNADEYEIDDWEDLSENSFPSKSCGGKSSNVLPPTQVLHQNVDTNEAPSPKDLAPLTHPEDPTGIQTSENTRTAQRWGSNRARHSRPLTRPPSSMFGSVYSGPCLRASGGCRGYDARRARPFDPQIKWMLEQGWDDRFASGIRAGFTLFSERPRPSLTAPKGWDDPRVVRSMFRPSAGTTTNLMAFPLKRAKFLAAERGGGTAKRTRYMSHMLGGDKQVEDRRTAPCQTDWTSIFPARRGIDVPSQPPYWPHSYDGDGHQAGGEVWTSELFQTGSLAAQTGIQESVPSNSFGVNGHLKGDSGCQTHLFTVRVVTIPPDGSTGQEVASTTLSPFDRLSSLRAAIRANVGLKFHNIFGNNKPTFVFSYADGVPIDRGHEDRLRIKQVIVQSHVSSATCVGPLTDDKKRLGTVFLQIVPVMYGPDRDQNCPPSSDERAKDIPLDVQTLDVQTGAHSRSSKPSINRPSRGFSVSFNEAKNKRHRMIRDQVKRLAEARVTAIEKIVRGYQMRVRYRGACLERHQKASRIQLYVRRKAARLELERRFCRRDNAIKIQCLSRSRMARREACLRRRRHGAATRVQSFGRVVLAKRERRLILRKMEAIITLQCWARSMVAKAKVGERLIEHRDVLAKRERWLMLRKKEAIITLQCWARGMAAKAKVAKLLIEHRSAILIECLMGKKAAREEASCLGEEERMAATRIQSLARARATRKKMVVEQYERDQLIAAEKTQSVAHVKAASLEDETRRARTDAAVKREAINEHREIAAITIGSIARGYCGRRRADKLRKKRDAAITIQRVVRGSVCRSQIRAASEDRENTEDVAMAMQPISELREHQECPRINSIIPNNTGKASEAVDHKANGGGQRTRCIVG